MTVDEAIKCYQDAMRIRKALVVNGQQGPSSEDFKLYKQYKSNCDNLLKSKKNKSILGTDRLNESVYNDVPQPRTSPSFFSASSLSQSNTPENVLRKRNISAPSADADYSTPSCR